LCFLGREEFLKAVEKITGKRLTESQKRAITSEARALKVVAGPGSGKTEVLVLRALYLMAVKGYHPKSLFLVSFTRRAAKELFSRVVTYGGKLKEAYPDLPLEPYDLYCGTLHSLAARVMDEFEYDKFLKYRLIGEFERRLLIYKNFKDDLEKESDPFFSAFSRNGEEVPTSKKLHILTLLFDFVVQNLVRFNDVDFSRLQPEEKRAVRRARELFNKYVKLVKATKLLDYALLELLFRDFLEESGEEFLLGDGTAFHPGIKAVLVDEYQDSNLLDQEVYFTLARKSGASVTVVGDDWQSLYHFRGAIVENFINFEKRCSKSLKVNPETVELVENFRSDPSIVDYQNFFLNSHMENEKFKDAWEALATKKELLPSAGFSCPSGNSVFFFEGSPEELARQLAEVLVKLKGLGVIENYSDAVFLLPSTREVRRFEEGEEETLASLVRKELKARGVKVYNPRSKAFKERKEVFSVLGTLVRLLPPVPVSYQVAEVISRWEADAVPLPSFLENSFKRMVLRGELGLLDLFFRVLPYGRFKEELEKFNLARLSQLLSEVEKFSAKEVEGWKKEGVLEEKVTEVLKEAQIDPPDPPHPEREKWLVRIGAKALSILEFFNSFLPLLLEGSVDEEELPEVPPDHFPIMTIHQAKGLEFPIVFVAGEGVSSEVDLGTLEKLFKDALKGYDYPSPWKRSQVEQAKRFFVAYSRPIYALIILNRRGLVYEEKRAYKTAEFPGFDPKGNSGFKGGGRGDS